MILIIANILSLMGNTLFTTSSLLKDKRKILVLQNSNYILSTIAEILQKAKYDQNFYVKIQVHDKIDFEDLN